jgi:hypothetical protein
MMNLERPSGWLLTTLMRTTSANRFFHGFWLRRKESRTAYCKTTWISFSLNCTGSRTHRTHSTTRAVEALCFVSTKTFSETSLDAQTWSFCMPCTSTTGTIFGHRLSSPRTSTDSGTCASASGAKATRWRCRRGWY